MNGYGKNKDNFKYFYRLWTNLSSIYFFSKLIQLKIYFKDDYFYLILSFIKWIQVYAISDILFIP